MQRAAASDSSAPSTPSEPPSKKQRLSNGSYNNTPSSTPRSDAQFVHEALAAEEQKRADALDREAADRGETKWYLSFQESPLPAAQTPLRIVSAGYGTLDAGSVAKGASSEEDAEESTTPQIKGRRSFGKFNRAVEVGIVSFNIRSRLLVYIEATEPRPRLGVRLFIPRVRFRR